MDDRIFMGNNFEMFKKAKLTVIWKFKMMDISLMSYFLGLEIKQSKEIIFISQ